VYFPETACFVRNSPGPRSKRGGRYTDTTMCMACFRLRLLRLRYRRRTENRRGAALENVVARLQSFVDRGVLTVIHGRGGLERLLHIQPSDDGYVISFECVSCEEEFLLLIAKGAFEMR
jgi:hypothetical protein